MNDPTTDSFTAVRRRERLLAAGLAVTLALSAFNAYSAFDSQQQPQRPSTVEARSVVLVDAEGRHRGRWICNPGGSSLQLLDDHGTVQAALTASEGRSRLYLCHGLRAVVVQAEDLATSVSLQEPASSRGISMLMTRGRLRVLGPRGEVLFEMPAPSSGSGPGPDPSHPLPGHP